MNYFPNGKLYILTLIPH